MPSANAPNNPDCHFNGRIKRTDGMLAKSTPALQDEIAEQGNVVPSPERGEAVRAVRGGPIEVVRLMGVDFSWIHQNHARKAVNHHVGEATDQQAKAKRVCNV
jgi:hypothetical protein